jgi:uncharacterized protein (DUF58 family)
VTFRSAAAQLIRWLTPRRRFPPTREGWWFLVATLLLGLAAINAGLNLLFLVWGMMLFLVLASGVLSELCLRHLQVSRKTPPAIHAGAPYLMGIALSNRKRRLPSFSVEVEDLVAGRPLDKRCYFLKLPAGRTQETAYRHQITQRGRYLLTGFRLSTKFPFGLIQKSRDVADPHELLIYPALVRVPESLLRGFPATHGLGRQKWRSRSGDFIGLRDYRAGDDPRDIHWRSSARRGVPLVRESEDDEGLEATVLFDNALPSGVSRDAFEASVSMAASVAHVLLQRGYRIGLGARAAEITPDGGPAQLTRILRFLALIEPAAASAPLHNPGRRGARILIQPGAAPSVGPAAGRDRDQGGGGRDHRRAPLDPIADGRPPGPGRRSA